MAEALNPDSRWQLWYTEADCHCGAGVPFFGHADTGETTWDRPAEGVFEAEDAPWSARPKRKRKQAARPHGMVDPTRPGISFASAKGGMKGFVAKQADLEAPVGDDADTSASPASGDTSSSDSDRALDEVQEDEVLGPAAGETAVEVVAEQGVEVAPAREEEEEEEEEEEADAPWSALFICFL